MSVLIAHDATGEGLSEEITLAAGDAVSLALVPSTDGGLPDKARASVAWKGAGDHNTDFGGPSLTSPLTVLSAPGTYVVTKGEGAYSVERSD